MHSTPAPASLVTPFVCPPLCQAQDPKGQIQKPFSVSGVSKLLFGPTSQLFPYPCQSPRPGKLRSTPSFSHSCPAYILHTSKHSLVVPAPCKTFLCLPPSLPTEVQSSLPRPNHMILLLQPFLNSHHPFEFLPGQNVPLSKYNPTFSALLANSVHSFFLMPGHEECIISGSSYSLSCPQHHEVVKKKYTRSV